MYLFWLHDGHYWVGNLGWKVTNIYLTEDCMMFTLFLLGGEGSWIEFNPHLNFVVLKEKWFGTYCVAIEVIWPIVKFDISNLCSVGNLSRYWQLLKSIIGFSLCEFTIELLKMCWNLVGWNTKLMIVEQLVLMAMVIWWE